MSFGEEAQQTVDRPVHSRLSRRIDAGYLLARPAKNVDIRESQAVLILLAAIPANRLTAPALAGLLSRRQGVERPCEVLVAWARGA